MGVQESLGVWRACDEETKSDEEGVAGRTCRNLATVAFWPDRAGGRQVAGTRRSGLVIAILAAGPAQAECLGSCADDLLAALISLVVYGVIGIVLLVMLIRAKWRRAGLWALAVGLVLAIGLPLISQGWLSWRLRSMEAHEIVGTPPPLADVTPLMIAPDSYCEDSPCGAVLEGRGSTGLYVLPVEGLSGFDLTRPIPLADLPLQHWSWSTTGVGERRVLTEDERREAAGRIDYLIVTSWPYTQGEPGAIEAALRPNPVLEGLSPDAAVRLLMARLPSIADGLSFATMGFDLLDLTLTSRAMALPLAPRNTQRADNRPTGIEQAVAAICPAGEGASSCREMLEQ